ncbi:reverse transcriptase domain-containing protein, partial [Nocardioides antri]|uniref:reverse transcriptase domain-containing protein n=1 Tax=Nocardioides antri TaxID=2607659 RepID=UPI0034CFA0F9
MSKAFDKVWHNGLKYKLITKALPKFLIRILSNYLDDRTASIRMGSYVGPPFDLLSGVPQRGCLSPTLFSFYTSDLPPPSGKNEHIIYADDITQIIL